MVVVVIQLLMEPHFKSQALVGPPPRITSSGSAPVSSSEYRVGGGRTINGATGPLDHRSSSTLLPWFRRQYVMSLVEKAASCTDGYSKAS